MESKQKLCLVQYKHTLITEYNNYGNYSTFEFLTGSRRIRGKKSSEDAARRAFVVQSDVPEHGVRIAKRRTAREAQSSLMLDCELELTRVVMRDTYGLLG